MSNPTDLARLLSSSAQILPDGLDVESSPLLPNRPIRHRLRHFDTDVYNLMPESHLRRFVGVLLGDAGVGALRKHTLLARLAQNASSTYFTDLDRFYGALFNISRNHQEQLQLNPNRDRAEAGVWEAQHARDGSYRSRVLQFARGLNKGATPWGLTLAAEALLTSDIGLHEVWRYLDDPDGFMADVSNIGSRREFVIRPHRPISGEERRALIQVLSRLKPADSLLSVDEEGVSIYEPVTLSDVRADSEFWEVTSHVSDRLINGQTPYGTGSGMMIELPRPPLSGYQGEMWSYYADISGVTSYTDTSDRPHYQRVQVGDSYHDFLPEWALLSAQDWLGGRMANDGSAVIHPLMARSGSTGGGDLYLDRVAVNDLLRVGRMRQSNLAEMSRFTEAASFWSTEERSPDDRTIEYLEVTLSNPSIVNRVLCLLPKFPHTATVEVYDDARNEWVEVGSQTIDHSRPALISMTDPAPGVHPQHHGPGHWQDTHFEFRPRTVNKVRVSLQRIDGNPPRNRQGQALDYSLAVRALEVGYQIRSRSDIPGHRMEGSGLVATSHDALGTVTEFRYRDDPATNLVVDDDNIWRSESLPSPNAVVNLHVDTRDAEGRAQRIGRFFMEPLTEGVTYSIYRSNDEPLTNFPASTEFLDFHQEGGVNRVEENTYDWDKEAPAWIDVSNLDLQFSPSRPWWCGLSLFTGFDSDSDAHHPLISFGSRTLSLERGAIRFAPTDLNDVTVFHQYGAGSRMDVILAYFPEGTEDFAAGYHMIARRGGSEGRDHTTDVNAMERPGTIRIGGSIKNPERISGMLLRAAVLKDGHLTPDQVDAFQSDPGSFVTAPQFAHVRTDYTRNSLMRFSPLLRANQEVGLRGGPADIYSEMKWSKVAADFRLTKGYITVPNRAAKFWKFEFTELVAEPYESLIDLTQQVKTHPEKALDDYRQTLFDRTDEGMDNFLEAHAYARTLHVSEPRTASQDEAVRRAFGLGTLEALVATSPDNAARLRDLSWLYGWESYHQAPTSPSFIEESKHLYETRQMAHQSKVGYFVGLRSIRAYRVNTDVADDTPYYDEDFLDDYPIVESTWVQTEDGWYTETANARASSRTFNSFSMVDAVQFASEHSRPEQLLPDPHFRERNFFIRNVWNDPNEWHEIGNVMLDWRSEDTTILVRRYGERTWGDIEDLGTYGELEEYTYGSLHSMDLSEFSPIAGIASPKVIPSGSKRYYAAARVIGTEELPSDLWLQLLDGNEKVLRERPFSPTLGEISDIHVGYTETGIRTYGDLEEFGTYGDLETLDTENSPTTYGFLELDNDANLAGLRARIVQKDEQRGSFRLAHFGIFDTSVTWEFSANNGEDWARADDIVNNPYGVLRFEQPGNQLRWRAKAHRTGVHLNSLQIRPWYSNRPVEDFVLPDQRGGNLAMDDMTTSILTEPEFKRWHHPIPEWWYLSRHKIDFAKHHRIRVFFDQPITMGMEIIEPYFVGYARQPESIEVEMRAVPPDVEHTSLGISVLEVGVEFHEPQVFPEPLEGNAFQEPFYDGTDPEE